MISFLEYVVETTTMNYNSLIFFVCLMVFLGIFFLLPHKTLKMIWILIGNLVFYMWSGWKPLLIVIMTAGIVYLASREMERIYAGFETEKLSLAHKEWGAALVKYKRRARRSLIAALFLILSVWIWVKAGKLFGMETVASYEDALSGKGIIVPLGISYYSLSAIGYLLDIYWRRATPEHNVLRLFAAMTYFPHIVQGPISKYSRLVQQLEEIPGFDYERVCFGFQRMLWGYIKKMVIADRLVLYTSAVFDDPMGFAGIEIILAIVLGVFQLYADFSGCMDIVLGISQMMGIELDENFKQPLFARNVAEFWRRWHITLGTWTKEYVYLPIAVNSGFMKWTRAMKAKGRNWTASFLKSFIPLAAVWTLTGLWHGTGWDYMAWGMYWCLLCTLSKECKPLMDKIHTRIGIRPERSWYRIWESVRTCILFGIGRMFTAAGGLEGCMLLWRRLFAQLRLWVLFDGSLYNYGLDQKDFTVALLGIIWMLLVDACHEKGIQIRKTIAAQPLPIRWVVYYGAMFSIVILGMYGAAYDAASFVYGAF